MFMSRLSWLVLLLTMTLSISACGDAASEAGEEPTDLTGSTDSTASGNETDTSESTDTSDTSGDTSDSGDSTDTPDDTTGSDETPADVAFTLTSDAMENAGVFPVRHACTYYYEAAGAENVSPHFAWVGQPSETGSFAIVFRDLTYNGFLHSIIFDIPADVTSLPESLARVAELTEPAGAKQSRGYTGEFGYEGPCPGPSEHTYEFELYAMPTATLAEVTTNSDMEDLEGAIEANALASTTLQAVFTPPQ